MKKKIDECVQFLKQNSNHTPETIVVLGSGLGAFAETLDEKVIIDYADIPHFQKTTVKGHTGKLILGKSGNRNVAALQGRYHIYEGHQLEAVVHPIRSLIQWGAKKVILTNAAGGINKTFRTGNLVLIKDHLNLMMKNPLTGANEESWGPRFPDMTEAYSKNFLRKAQEVANKIFNHPLPTGVYAGVLGPTYETPAEVRMLEVLGSDMVGMSTVPETIAAVHMGAEVLGISCITNAAAGIGDEKLSHHDVKTEAKKVEEVFSKYVHQVIAVL